MNASQIRKSIPWILVASALWVWFYNVSLSHNPVAHSMRLKLLDGLYQHQYRAVKGKSLPEKPPIVIVAIDQDSIRRLNRRWPWPRSLLAEGILKITASGAQTVALDLSMSAASDNAGDDEKLAAAMRQAGNVILSGYFDRDGAWVGPIRPFQEASGGQVGFLNMPRDTDGINRRISSRQMSGKGSEYAFSLMITAHYLQTRAHQLDRAGERFRLHPSEQGPLASEAKPYPFMSDMTLIPYRYRWDDIPLVPFWKVMTDAYDPTEFKNKIVLVGAVGEIFHDEYPTPLGTLPGVFIHANCIAAQASGSGLKVPPREVAGVAVFGFMVLAAFLFLKLRFTLSAALLLAFSLGAIEAAGILFENGWVIDVLSVLGGLLTAFILAELLRAIILVEENHRLKEQVLKDGLTGLYTYRFLEKKLMAEFDQSRKTGAALSFVIFDLDHFKLVNDRYGHEQGNQILMAFAKILKASIRSSDIIARYGGEEFCIVLPSRTCDEAVGIAERIRQTLSGTRFSFIDRHTGNWAEVHSTVSAGVASTENPGIFNGKELLRLADLALLKAKAEGRDRVLRHTV